MNKESIYIHIYMQTHRYVPELTRNTYEGRCALFVGSVHMYIYIHIYTCMHMYVLTHVYIRI